MAIVVHVLLLVAYTSIAVGSEIADNRWGIAFGYVGVGYSIASLLHHTIF